MHAPDMPRFRDAVPNDIPHIAALQNAVSGALIAPWPADAIRLDAYDAKAGAGGFYSTCGFAPRGAVSYKDTPLLYFERLVSTCACYRVSAIRSTMARRPSISRRILLSTCVSPPTCNCVA